MNKGQYYKLKTKKWFLAKGYMCEYLEKLQRIVTKDKKIIWVKRDIFSADGIAMKENELIFWNAKYGKKNVAKGIKEFLKYPYPNFVSRWLIIWEQRAREPEIVEVEQ